MNGSKLLVLACLALAACGAEEEVGDQDQAGVVAATDSAALETLPPADTMAMQGGAAGQLSDASVAAILSVADSGEIRPSQLAANQAQNAQVTEYAQMMIRDHGMFEDSLRALAQRLGVTPQPSPTSQQLRTRADSAVQALQGQSGAAFDQAYMQWMVQSHQATLNALDQQLIPAIQNPEMRAMVQQRVRPAVEQHLQRAQQLRSSVGGS